ncbi:MAG: hypothetical protein HYS12_11025 [Planctomycetes bacterium]|nr:hypothetical protein [Planctomycetota bacterium]
MLSNLCRLMGKLWADDCGALLATEYMTLGAVVVLGGVGGLASMRDAVNDEMKEYGNSVRQIRQQYSVPGFKGAGASTAGSAATDAGGSASVLMAP